MGYIAFCLGFIRMRRAARTDENHAEIMQAFRHLGCSVHDTSRAGQGYPDISIGFTGLHGPVTVLVEIKHGAKTASRKQLTGAQKIWHNNWMGAKAIVESVEQAAELVNSYRRGRK